MKMETEAVLPPQGAAKVAITLTAVSAGSTLGLFSATWIHDGFGAALPLLVGGILLLGFGGFMWKGTPAAYVGTLSTEVGLYLYALAGMAGFLSLSNSVWHIAGLGGLSVLAVSVIVFCAVYLRDTRTWETLRRQANARPANPGAPAKQAEAPSGGHDTN